MIKKLSLKFVLVFLILVVSVIITSSCYASEEYTYKDFNITIDKEAKTITTLHVPSNLSKTTDISYGLDNYSNYYLVVSDYNAYPSMYTINYNFGLIFSDEFSWKEYSAESAYTYCDQNQYIYALQFIQWVSNGNYVFQLPYSKEGFSDSENSSLYYTRTKHLISLDYDYNYIIPDTEILTASHTITAPNGTVLYEFSEAIDTSFDYSFEGITRGQTKLSINNLDSSLNMYGYVGLDTTFSVGDTLDTTANINNLRLMASRADNSDLNCYLYEGEELNYYIVDENNVILDTGYISEMAKGYFLYSFEVYNGVDFVFLKDGQVYWSNDLTFKYSVGSSSEHEKNDVVSMGVSSYIVTDKTVASNSYNGFVYDSSNNLIAQASTVISNDLSSISISVDTSYYEVHTVLKHYSCYWLKSFELDGTNKDGSYIDFSNYYAKWSIPTWLELKSITIDFEEYSKRNGIITGFSSAGSCSMFNLEIFEFLSDHKMSFDIKLEIYDSEDNLVLTHLINSDDIVKNQIASDENNVDKGDYDIVDNPNYTGGSSGSPDINNIQNWTADDYANLMSTDNFVWEFFKAILGNLPWWITTPLTILLFGVVIITLIRFARGA